MPNISDISDLVGGTLVEYLARAGFSQEWGRATILSVNVNNAEDKITVGTDNPARLMTTDFSRAALATVDGVIYLIPSPTSHLDYYFALAPKGVKIPTPDERGRRWNPFRRSG